jgi:membrane protein required for colicin V production
VPIVDLVAAGVLAAAMLRGLWIGMLREAFSLAALACAVIAVRRFSEPVARAIASRWELEPLLASAAAGAVVAVATILAVSLVGAIVRRSVHAAGLGLADRLGGAALGAAEGALAVAILMIGAIAVLGRTDPMLAGSRTLAVFEQVEGVFGGEAGGARGARAPCYDGSTQRPCRRISSTSRASASAAGMWRSTQVWPTYRFTRPGPEPT